MAPPIGRVYDLAAHLLECVCLQLGSACPSRACVVPGQQVAWDNCCAGEQGGQLTVNVARAYPSRNFPDLDQGRPSNCVAPYMVVQYNVTILRCSPSQNERGKPPPCDALNANSELTLRDLEQVRIATACCLLDEDSIVLLLGQPYSWVFGDAVTLGPEGGCAGSQLIAFVGMPPCYDC